MLNIPDFRHAHNSSTPVHLPRPQVTFNIKSPLNATPTLQTRHQRSVSTLQHLNDYNDGPLATLENSVIIRDRHLTPDMPRIDVPRASILKNSSFLGFSKNSSNTPMSRSPMNVLLHTPKILKEVDSDTLSIPRSPIDEILTKPRPRVDDPRPKEPIRNAPKSTKAQSISISSYVSPNPVEDHYNYFSQHTLFIPENLNIKSATNNKSSFLGFNELARIGNSTHHSALKSLIMEDLSAKKLQQQQSESQTQLPKNTVTLGKLKKVLSFNKLQKKTYDVEIYRQQKDKLLPMVNDERERSSKERKMVHIKKGPSKNIFYKLASENMAQKNLNFDSSMNNSGAVGSSISKLMTTTTIPEEETGKERILKRLDTLDNQFGNVSMVYRFFWYSNSEDRGNWAPEAREGHTFTTVGKHMVLYGGISDVAKNDVVLYHPGKNMWKRIQTTGDRPSNGRYGHSACAFKDSIIYFGGESNFNPDLKYRETLGDVRSLSLSRGEWRYHTFAGNPCPARHHHTAIIQDRNMYVYGGISNEGSFLSDLWFLNLRTFTWTQCEMKYDKNSELAFHSMAACYSSLGAIQVQKSKIKTRSIEEGLYVFGGKDSSGNISNVLKSIDPAAKPPVWRYPTTKGNPPSERFNHTMIFYEPLLLLIIYGGRNSNFHSNNPGPDLTDLKVLHLESMTWTTVVSYGDVPKIPRANHAAALFGSSIVIFGGLGNREYLPTKAKIVELSQSSVKKLKDESELKYGPISFHRMSEFSPDVSPERAISLKKVISDEKMITPNLSSVSGVSNAKTQQPDQEIREPKRHLSFMPDPLPQIFTKEEHKEEEEAQSPGKSKFEIAKDKLKVLSIVKKWNEMRKNVIGTMSSKDSKHGDLERKLSD